MSNKHSDIDTAIAEIERATILVEDHSIDINIRDFSIAQFINRNAKNLIALLDELKNLRDQNNGSIPIGGFNKSHRVVLEGFSDKSSEAALSDALDKATYYFSEDHDIAITIQQLMELPNGGHRAVLEIHITPFTLKQKPHIIGRDIELRRDHDKAFRNARHKEDVALQHLVFDHFSALTKPKTIGHIPSSFMINVTDAKLMSYILEKQFLKAEQFQKISQMEILEPTPELPHKIKVNVKREPE